MEAIFILIIIVAILAAVGKFLFWIWISITVWKGAVEAQRFYSAAFEQQLRQIALLVQQQEINEAQERAAAARRYVNSLPRQERRIYQHKLSDVVQGKRVLNPSTGEWEKG